MNNKKYYPFKRNNYFYGKLLTVRDFEEEQKYLNDKRRLNNVLTNGLGVVSGLTAVLINEKTISVEAGLALDCLGREIVVEESVTKKLNVIDGFDEVNDEQDVYLCIKYFEELKEPVYSVTEDRDGAGGKSEYNRANEAYSLYLTNMPLHRESAAKRLMREQNILYEGEGIKVIQITPLFVNPSQAVDIKIRIEKTKLVKNLEVDFCIRGDHLKNPDGSDFVHVYYKDEELVEYKTVELAYSMIAGSVFDTEAEIIIENGIVNMGAVRGGINYQGAKITITKENIYDVTMRRYLSLHFDDVLNMTDEIPIYLAKFRLVKQEGEYFVKEFYPMPFDQYIVSNEMLYEYIRGIKNNKPVLNVKPPLAVSEEKKEAEISIRNGMEKIEIDLRCKNKTYFTGEIAHGLGRGDVFVHIALEDFKNTKIFEDTNRIVSGDIAALLNTPYEPEMAPYTSAVITYTDKGTFRACVKFFENMERSEITVKWWAVKNNRTGIINYAEADTVSITIDQKSVSLAPREKFKFSAAINGTSDKECRWSVVDKDGGEIDLNGIYQAPIQEGVYEIMAQSVKYPHKRATTFVVVRR